MSNKSPPHITRLSDLLEAVREQVSQLPTKASDTAVAEILCNLDEVRWLLRASQEKKHAWSVLGELSVELLAAMLREIGRSSNYNLPRSTRTDGRWSVSVRRFATPEKLAA